MKINLTVEGEKRRIDKYLAEKYSDYSRGYFQQLVKDGAITVNDECVNPSYSLKPGDILKGELKPKTKKAVAENIKLNIIFEDKDLIVVNKPAGLVVHPACGHETGTLYNALLGYAKGKFVPLMVHRLDKDTTGIIIIAKNERAKNSLVKQFQKRVVKKTYLAAVKGFIKEKKGYIDAPIGRAPGDRKRMVVGPLAKKKAITEFVVSESGHKFSIVEVRPLTGRTHQIRSHMSYIGHPVLGDSLYGGPEHIGEMIFKRQMLHAYKISFTHPSTCKTVSFCAPVPKDLKKLIDIC